MKNTHWSEVLGNDVNAAEIVNRANAANMSIENWVSNEIAEIASACPGEGYDEYDASDVDTFTGQIQYEAEDYED